MNKAIYLDNNATTMLLPEVKDRIIEIINSEYGNPSSPHSYSHFGQKILIEARDSISKFINCTTEQVIFTASGSESNNQVLQSVRFWNEPRGIITSKTEHSSIIKTIDFLTTQNVKIFSLDVNNKGIIDLDKLELELKTKKYSLVSIAAANSETGVIQPLEDIINITHKYNALFHTDAAQYIGRVPIDFSALKIDFLTFTAHKLHAPQGTAVLVAKDRNKIVSLIWGGEQENQKRAGTENIIGIGALAKAIDMRTQSFSKTISKLKDLRDYFEKQLLKSIDDIFINGDVHNRVPNVSNICFKKTDGFAIVAQLDNQGVICSQTSACTSQIPEPSHVLLAMGLTEEDAFNSIRFSFSVENTISEIDDVIKKIIEVVSNIRKLNSRGFL